MWARVAETQIWSTPECLAWVREGLKERNHGICQHSSLRESCPSSPSPSPKNSVPPYMSLVPFMLLPHYWCSGKVSFSVRESVHCHFKRKILYSSSPLPPSAVITSIFQPKLWGFLFPGLEPLAGEPGVGLGPLIQLPSEADISLQIFNCIFDDWGHTDPRSPSSPDKRKQNLSYITTFWKRKERLLLINLISN